MTIQWHSYFAALLRPIIESYYDVDTNMPVGDAPREADIVVVRRKRDGSPPFRGVWRHLQVLNVLEFKGPTVSPRLADLDLLVELGLGIHRWHSAEAVKVKQTPIAAEQVALWYLVKHVGRRFRRGAEQRLGPLMDLGEGVWRARVLNRSIFFVGGSDLPVDLESTPFHFLDVRSSAKGRATVQLMRDQPALLASYIPFLGKVPLRLLQELQAMVRKRGKGPDLDIAPIAELIGIKSVIDQLGTKRVIDELGAERVIDQLGAERVIDQLGAERVIDQLGAERVIDVAFRHLSEAERAELKRRMKKRK